MGSERERVELLRRVLASTPDPRVALGIGDDAAVLARPWGPLVWTVDASVEGVHFQRDWLGLADIGYRATMAAASDLAAMGASPLGLLSALVLPRSFGDGELEALAEGQREAASELGTAVVGGNLSRGGELSITTTALGVAPRPLRRDGAKPGDELWLSGSAGLAGAGLTFLERGLRAGDAAALALGAFRRPRARIAEGLLAAPLATAAIDLSDGLAHDVALLAEASGVSAVFDESQLAGPELEAVAAELGASPVKLALFGGEDYALVVALPRGRWLSGFRRIGEMIEKDARGALLLRAPSGSVAPLEPSGHDHFER